MQQFCTDVHLSLNDVVGLLDLLTVFVHPKELDLDFGQLWDLNQDKLDFLGSKMIVAFDFEIPGGGRYGSKYLFDGHRQVWFQP
jgi:hypothetical protein